MVEISDAINALLRETKIYDLTFRDGAPADWRPDPFPGTTPECTCPKDQSSWPHGLRISSDCPTHPLVGVP